MATKLEEAVAQRLEPWSAALGADRPVYTNHVLRVLSFCDALAGRTSGNTTAPSTREEFLTAAVFHDLGAWTANTFDYLAPSIDLAREWLTANSREDLIPLVVTMIDDHHKIRRAHGAEVELFRRADTIDVTAGLRRFGMARNDYRAVLDRYPATGFRPRLARFAAERTRAHPLSPFPMVKW
ncbi:hypothetical protein [Nocardia sp. NPDC020380]|uniref:hypothetical protein n=1 Tax=Nocardia sp. NPDC020380 TaxID=3364309 RepID=UPI0037A32FB1